MFQGSRYVGIAIFLAGSLYAAQVLAQPSDQLTWDRTNARAAATSINIRPTVSELFNLTIAGSTPEVLNGLEAVRANEDWPEPSRDAAVFGYTDELRALPASSVPPEVMTYLKAYRPLTWLVHEDHPAGRVPMYDIRSAAHGVENLWSRQEAKLEGIALLRAKPRSLTDAWLLDDNPAVRRGYLGSLELATAPQLAGVLSNSKARLGRHPELTALASQAAILAEDYEALAGILAKGDGPAVTHSLRQAGGKLTPVENLDLLQHVVYNGSPKAASIAIAELGRRAETLPGTRDLLLDLLANPELGSTAALALSRDDALFTQDALAELGSSEDQVAARNARLAMDLHQARITEGISR